jgi:hypothetical protein
MKVFCIAQSQSGGSLYDDPPFKEIPMTTAELDQATRRTNPATTTNMKALVYHGPGKRAWENKPRPTIQNPSDAIVRINTSKIGGTDLHILNGDLPAVTEGRILGHEGARTSRSA